MHEPRPFDHASTWHRDSLRTEAMRKPDTCNFYKDYGVPSRKDRASALWGAVVVIALMVMGAVIWGVS